MTDELNIEEQAKLARALVDGAPKFRTQLEKAGLRASAKHFNGALFKIMLMETISLEKKVKLAKPELKKKKSK